MTHSTMFLRLRLREILHEQGLSQAKLSRETGLSEDRICQLVNDQWVQLRMDEIGVLLYVLRVTPAQLIEAHRPTIFHSAKYTGPLQIHKSSRWLNGDEQLRPTGAGVKPLIFVGRDVEAADLVLDYALENGVTVKNRRHNPG